MRWSAPNGSLHAGSGGDLPSYAAVYTKVAYAQIARRCVFVFALLALGVLVAHPPAVAAGHVVVGGPFELRTSGGVTVTDRTYRGKWLLVYFGYTSCPESCPLALANIASALNTLGPDARLVQPLFVTIDPRRDTPARLAEYTSSIDPRIVGLTGTPAAIESAEKGYGAYALPREADENQGFDHSVYIYLMGPDGHFLRAFDSQSSSKEIATAVRSEIARSKLTNAQAEGARSGASNGL